MTELWKDCYICRMYIYIYIYIYIYVIILLLVQRKKKVSILKRVSPQKDLLFCIIYFTQKLETREGVKWII